MAVSINCLNNSHTNRSVYAFSVLPVFIYMYVLSDHSRFSTGPMKASSDKIGPTGLRVLARPYPNDFVLFVQGLYLDKKTLPFVYDRRRIWVQSERPESFYFSNGPFCHLKTGTVEPGLSDA